MSTRTAICHRSVRRVVVLLLIVGLCFFSVEESLAQADSTQEEVKRLIEQLEDEDVQERRSATFALGLIGPEAASAVEALIETLKDEDAKVRRYAAEALGRIGPAAAPAVEALIEALKDKNHNVRYWAAEALGSIDPTSNPSP